MGMYDYIKIDTALLPVTQDELKGKDTEWQTKDFDCELLNVFITNDGEIEIERCEREFIPASREVVDSDVHSTQKLGSSKIISTTREKVEYHGMISFYSSDFHFTAKFTDNKLVGVTRNKGW